MLTKLHYSRLSCKHAYAVNLYLALSHFLFIPTFEYSAKRVLLLQRIKPKTDFQKEASKYVPKPKKVSPGYKKKRQAQIDELAERLKRNSKRKKK